MTSWDFMIFFLSELYPRMGETGEPNSLPILDGAPIHHWNVWQLICEMLDVHYLYLPSYSCDFNAPVEEFFRALKANLKRMRTSYQNDPEETIYLNVDAMCDWDIFPICDRIGYTQFCNFR